MAGAMRKVGVYLGLVEDADRYDDDYDDQEPDVDPRDTRPVRAVRTQSTDAPVTQLVPRSRPAEPVRGELARIITVHPRTYNEARTIGEHFRDSVPVIMNLSEMEDNDAKRLVDFAAGLVFAVHGTIERVTAKVFLLSPPDVIVDAEEKQRLAEGGFFNQS
jgi:cell division inhibitor SepF